jgi:hypothetical protein
MVGVRVMVGSGVGVAVLVAEVVARAVGVLVGMVVVAPPHAHSKSAIKSISYPAFFMKRLLLWRYYHKSFGNLLPYPAEAAFPGASGSEYQAICPKRCCAKAG